MKLQFIVDGNFFWKRTPTKAAVLLNNSGSETPERELASLNTIRLFPAPPPIEYEFLKYKLGGNAQLPITRGPENPEGKKVIGNGGNGGQRFHRYLTDDEKLRGRATRWTELEIHGYYLIEF